jgi:hypothetical protein
LRAALAHLHVEAYRGARRKLVELGIDHAVTMKETSPIPGASILP